MKYIEYFRCKSRKQWNKDFSRFIIFISLEPYSHIYDVISHFEQRAA